MGSFASGSIDSGKENEAKVSDLGNLTTAAVAGAPDVIATLMRGSQGTVL